MRIRSGTTVIVLLVLYAVAFWTLTAAMLTDAPYFDTILGCLTLMSLGVGLLVTSLVGLKPFLLWAVATFVLSLLVWWVVLRRLLVKRT
jgi:hypothetical protein